MIRSMLVAVLSALALLSQEKVATSVSPVAESLPVPTEFFINNENIPGSLDPAFMRGMTDLRLYMALFEGLVIPGTRGCEVEPGLADSWTTSSDLKTYTFHLRNALWSNGTPIQASEVVDSWLRVLAPATQAKNAGDLIDTVEGASEFHLGKGPREKVSLRALDSQTFEIHFKKPMPHATSMLVEPCFAVVPQVAVQEHAENWTKPEHFVGNGPFVLRQWDSDGKILVEKNSHYWDSGNVMLDRIIFEPIEDEGFAFEKFKAGEIDWSPAIDINRYAEIRCRQDFQATAAAATYYYKFNLGRKPFNDSRVRKALSMAIDRQMLCDKIIGTGQIASCGLVPPLGGYTPLAGNAYDPERARQLLAEAGYPGGKGFPSFTVIYNTHAVHERVTEWILGQWKSVLGIDGKAENLGWESYKAWRTRHDFDICRIGWNVNTPDPIEFLNQFRRGNSDNEGQYSNVSFDNLLDRADQLPLGSERNQLLKAAEEIAVTQDQALMPLFFYPVPDLIDLQRWGGWYSNPLGIHPWKAIFPKNQAGQKPTLASSDVAEAGKGASICDISHYYQLDSRIGTGATGLCGPTSSAMAVDYLSKQFPMLKPEGTSGFDLIRHFADEEGAGKTTGVTDFSIEVRLERYIKKAGYKPTIKTLGVVCHGSSSTYIPYEFKDVKQALTEKGTSVLVITGRYDYDQRRNDYIRQSGHVMVLAGYDQDGLVLADPSSMSNRSHYQMVPVSHQGARLMGSSKTFTLARPGIGYMELLRHPWGHDIIETIILVHVSNT
jgi:oligopeptide transport system substrate-binding protein